MVVFAVNPKEAVNKVLESMNESRKAGGTTAYLII